MRVLVSLCRKPWPAEPWSPALIIRLGEVAGDAAITFNPESVHELTAAMLRGLTDEDERRQLRERGFRRAQTLIGTNTPPNSSIEA